MMRRLYLIFTSLFFLTLAVQAQPGVSVLYPLPGNVFNNQPLPGDTSHINSRWSFSKYAGFSAGYGFPYGSTSVSVPLGMQMNYRINKNVYAFTGVTVAPTYYTFRNSFVQSDKYLNSPAFLNTTGFGVFSGVYGGLMYVNDDRTFSISGSIGIETGSFPAYIPPDSRFQQNTAPDRKKYR